MEYQYVQNLTTERDNWFLKVCVVRFWDVFTPQNQQDSILVEMMLLNEQLNTLYKNYSFSYTHLTQYYFTLACLATKNHTSIFKYNTNKRIYIHKTKIFKLIQIVNT